MRPCIIKNLRWKNNVLVGDVMTPELGLYPEVPIRSTIPMAEFSPDPVSSYEGLCEYYDDGYVYALLTFPIIDTRHDVNPGETRFRSFLGDEIVLGNKFIKFLSGPVKIEIDGVKGKIKALAKEFQYDSPQGEIITYEKDIEIKVIEDPKSRKEVATLKFHGGSDPYIDLDVKHNSKIKLDKTQVEVKAGTSRLVIKQDKNIELKNPQAHLKIKPNGEIELGNSPAKLILKANGKVEIHGHSGITLVGPFTNSKVLTSNMVFCPILGPLTMFGEPNLKTQSG